MYKTMYQKYQIENSKVDCQSGYKPQTQYYSSKKCENIPAHVWVKPRYNSHPIREDYAVSAANITIGEKGGNSCKFFECPLKSSSKFGSVNQMKSYYQMGPHTNLSDPPEFVYAMPNQNLIYGSWLCPENLKETPWYGTYDAQ